MSASSSRRLKRRDLRERTFVGLARGEHIIYSDGTGQRGGITFDERRSNIYKSFRATRSGPDSDVDPAEQVAFYDPGLGTVPDPFPLPSVRFNWIQFARRSTGT
jgi:uncharacterized protein (DUF2235 family)